MCTARVQRQRGCATDGSCHVMSLVEGRRCCWRRPDGQRQRFNYAETFVVPAAAGSYTLTSESGQPLRVVKAFIKPRAMWPAGVVA